jgi:hypothetical protein
MGSAGVELAEGYRVRFQRTRGLWEARREETGARIAVAASLEDAYRRAQRHYEALGGH